MGLFCRLKYAFLHVAGLYDKPYALYAAAKGVGPVRLIKEQPSANASQSNITIWRRNLVPFKSVPTTVGRLGHWCLQVGETYFELLVPEGHTELKITHGPDHPFHGYSYEASSITSTTPFTPERVRTIAHKIYASEFENHYGVGRQDCQRFIKRLFEEVCAKEDEYKVDASYFKSFAFAVAYSTMSPPSHISNPDKVTSSPRNHARRSGHGGSHVRHGGGHGASITGSGWFQSILAMPPPR